MVCVLPWSTASKPPVLNPGEVHLWSASLLVSDEQFLMFERYLDERELTRANRYAMEIARARFICARAILKHLLALYTGDEPTSIRFRLGPLGKPYLPTNSRPQLYFNSTDTQDEALFAFCLDAELGIDIEYKTRKVNHSIIVNRKFTPQEIQQYHARTSEQRRGYFLSVWTRKEAYGKAIGVGIKYRLNQVNLVDAEDSVRHSVRDDSETDWEIVQIEPADDMIACVVTQGSGWRFRCHRLELDTG